MNTVPLAPELPPTPRDVRLRAGHRFARVLLLLLALGAPAGMVAVSQAKARDLQHIVDDGAVVDGAVESLRKRHGNRGSTSYYVHYGFDVDAAHFTGSAKVSSSRWQGLSTGMAIEISYWRADPHISRLGKVTQADADDEVRTGWLVGGLLLLVFGGVLLFLERTCRRHLMLLRDGHAVIGHVVSYTGFRSAKKKDRLAYRFRRPAGEHVDAVARLGRKPKPAPQPGSDIVVLLSPVDPAVFAPLPQLLDYVELQQ